MKRNEEITELAKKIMIDITDNRLPLHNILLEASRLSAFLDMPDNVRIFQDWAKYAEQNQFIIDTFKANIDAAKDRDVSISSANPGQYVWSPIGNFMERNTIRNEAKQIIGFLAKYRTETYDFAMGVYAKWQFGNIAENIFEKKRKKVEPILRKIFNDINQRLNSIEQNIRSINPEDWKNSVVSCRTLLMDLADILKPANKPDEKGQYINRLKDFVSEKTKSDTGGKLIKTYIEELHKKIEHTIGLTQGGAHKDRPSVDEAEDVILYTYLVVADLMTIYELDAKKEELSEKIPAKELKT